MYHLFKGTDVRDRSVFDLQSHFGKLRQRAAEYAAANGKPHNIRQIIKVDERRQRAVRQTAQRLNKAVKINNTLIFGDCLIGFSKQERFHHTSLSL